MPAIKRMPVPKQPNIVYSDVRDRDGRRLYVCAEPHDGTESGIMDAASKIRSRIIQDFDASFCQSRIGASDEAGKPRWLISPNLRFLAEIGTPLGEYISGRGPKPAELA